MQFLRNIVFRAFKKSAGTALWLLKIILPISLLVRFLDYYGVLAFMADFLDPVFVYMGLPGSTAIVFITSIFLPLYAPLAIITSMSITLRELTILALMCQISHNLPVESAIQAKTGTSFRAMTVLRIVTSIFTGIVLNLILPREMGMPIFVQTDMVVMTSIADVLLLWLKSSLNIALLIVVIVFTLNLLYNLLEAYRLIPKLSRAVEPLLRLFGLPTSTAFLWLIGYIVGLAYGGALMMDQMKEGKVTRTEASLLNYHLAVSHSVLEDNLLFVALGVSIWWILGVRFVIAWMVVWLRRFILKLRFGQMRLKAES
ncbi:MAG: nucleoside recognition protein [Bacteroidetes bacterium GWD2_45_23]|nr:MAG: nucleoside recognition protein [Bacteroidetes bacterium GWC2_46_850]OFX81280.1 MAG: nucleoside recognition protein [Bacteroidetes bacterium GWC1_47_7]OFX87092.1 MAG: nucleoside recognition protein [Bacteroidetes bacterium GWD2_45_23]HAR38953.1 nucleoside recognition protein [Porphyromonadaceae bacterium]HBB01826.1 nucleoside recognition protein [Porphyromonadaceae bacterium]